VIVILALITPVLHQRMNIETEVDSVQVQVGVRLSQAADQLGSSQQHQKTPAAVLK
jgi:hypothetical protein